MGAVACSATTLGKRRHWASDNRTHQRVQLPAWVSSINFGSTHKCACLFPREAKDYGWPGSAALLSLRLWGATFPLSDKRHPVATPAALLTGLPKPCWAWLLCCRNPLRGQCTLVMLLSEGAAGKPVGGRKPDVGAHQLPSICRSTGAYLAACSVVGRRHAAVGLLLAGMAHLGRI